MPNIEMLISVRESSQLRADGGMEVRRLIDRPGEDGIVDQRRRVLVLAPVLFLDDERSGSDTVASTCSTPGASVLREQSPSPTQRGRRREHCSSENGRLSVLIVSLLHYGS